MAEYITKELLDANIVEIMVQGGNFVPVIQAEIIDHIPTADVVEREEYEFVRHQLSETMDRVAELDKLNGELRSNIDNAIEEVEKKKEWLLSTECSGYNIGIAFDSIIHTLKKLGE